MHFLCVHSEEIDKPKKVVCVFVSCACLSFVAVENNTQLISIIFWGGLIFCRLGFDTCSNDNTEAVYM